MRYLLDTNAVIAFVGKTSMRLVERLLARPSGDIGLPSIVLYELSYGAYRSERVAFNLSTLRQLMQNLPVLDFDAVDADAAGRIRADLERIGTPIGGNDTLIAGQAKARDLCLVTNNTREFERVPGLRLENWMA